ncbi:MAG: hypothetical protein ACM65L_26235 [Microcoleus sp.]
MATAQAVIDLKERSPIIHQKCDRPSCIRVNLRPSAVKKERSPFLTIQKGDRSFYNQKGDRPSFLKSDRPFSTIRIASTQKSCYNLLIH